MGDVRVGRYAVLELASQSSQLSLAILLWVGAMSASDGHGKEETVAYVQRNNY